MRKIKGARDAYASRVTCTRDRCKHSVAIEWDWLGLSDVSVTPDWREYRLRGGAKGKYRWQAINAREEALGRNKAVAKVR